MVDLALSVSIDITIADTRGTR